MVKKGAAGPSGRAATRLSARGPPLAEVPHDPDVEVRVVVLANGPVSQVVHGMVRASTPKSSSPLSWSPGLSTSGRLLLLLHPTRADCSARWGVEPLGREALPIVALPLSYPTRVGAGVEPATHECHHQAAVDRVDATVRPPFAVSLARSGPLRRGPAAGRAAVGELRPVEGARTFPVTALGRAASVPVLGAWSLLDPASCVLDDWIKCYPFGAK